MRRVASLHGVLCLWWFSTAVGALAVGSPLLPWFDVLTNVPFESVESDVELLFDRLFTGATPAHALSVGALLEAALWQVVLWRVLLVVPVALAMSVVTRSSRATPLPGSVEVRAVSGALMRLPRFLSVTFALQTTALVGGSLGCVWAASRLLASEGHVLGVSLGVAGLLLSGLFCAICLTILEAARLALFRRSTSFTKVTTWSCILDGIALLRRYGWRLLGTVTGFGALATTLTGAFAMLAMVTAAAWPSAFGNVLAWAMAQIGVVAAIACRVASWRVVWRRMDVERGE